MDTDRSSVGKVGNDVHHIIELLPFAELHQAIAYTKSAQETLGALAISSGPLSEAADALRTALSSGVEARHQLVQAKNLVEIYLEEIGIVAELPAGNWRGVDVIDVSARAVLDSASPFYILDGPDNDIIKFRDPVTGGVLHPGEVPPSLLQDEGLRKGFAFWEQYGHEVAFRLLPMRHGGYGDIARSNLDLRAEAIRVARTGGVLFLEYYAPTYERDQLLDTLNRSGAGVDYSAIPLAQLFKDKNLGTAGFLRELHEQVYDTGVMCDLPDCNTDSGQPGDVTIDKVCVTWQEESKRAYAHGESILLQIQAHILRTYAQYMRNMGMIGRMGERLASVHQPGRFTNAALLVGPAHNGISDDLRRYNVTVSQTPGPQALDFPALEECREQGTRTLILRQSDMIVAHNKDIQDLERRRTQEDSIHAHFLRKRRRQNRG